MPWFQHWQTGEKREWRTDNEGIISRLHGLGWLPVDVSVDSPVDLSALPENVQALLPYRTADEVRKATDDELLALDGVGPATVRKIREALR